ncbi:hypothetical protein A2U01_0047518, partial [Trifolium medium]|nr:hypothetical protein [Trifolium medium]MCI26323.1 hypothetical protein [Trifolium medium]
MLESRNFGPYLQYLANLLEKPESGLLAGRAIARSGEECQKPLPDFRTSSLSEEWLAERAGAELSPIYRAKPPLS